MKPWEEELANLWRWIVGENKGRAVALVLLIIVIPGAIGVAQFYIKSFKGIWENLKPVTTTLSVGEKTALDEWVAVISYWPSKLEAEHQASIFKNSYLEHETEMRSDTNGDYPIWKNDIFAVRDPKSGNRWMVIIDTWSGTSNSVAVSAELARIISLGDVSAESQNTYQRLFINSRAVCYSQKTFEKNHGTIEPALNKDTPPCE